MLNQIVETTNTPPSLAWQDRLRSALTGCVHDVATLVAGTIVPDEVDFGLLKAGEYSLSLRVEADGCRAFLKLYDTSAGRDAYLREKAALLILRRSALVPLVTAFSDKYQFFLLPWLDQFTSITHQNSHEISAVGAKLGTWQAHYDAVSPTQPLTGNWYGYLKKFGSDLNMDRVETASDLLSAIPLCGQALARNDASLENYVVDEDNRLLGVDFGKAGLRPCGWDYLLGFHALIQRFPDNVETALEAYSQAYSQSHSGALLVEELNEVARHLFIAQALTGAQTKEPAPWQ